MSSAPQAPPAKSSSGSSDSAWMPAPVEYEDSMGAASVAKAWRVIYSKAGVNGEAAQKGVRAAAYLYALANGTSREGAYSAPMRTGDGTVVESSAIPAAAGKMHIRKFMRGNMDESYRLLKEMDLTALAPRVVAKAALLGIPSDIAFATADWLTDCSLFTPQETKAHQTSFEYATQRARRARGGSLETVEAERVHRDLEAQGPDANGRVDF